MQQIVSNDNTSEHNSPTKHQGYTDFQIYS